MPRKILQARDKPTLKECADELRLLEGRAETIAIQIEDLGAEFVDDFEDSPDAETLNDVADNIRQVESYAEGAASDLETVLEKLG